MLSVPIVTSCSNGITLVNGVFCAVRAEAIYNKDQLPLRDSLETAARRVGG
jgi:hypothetical protein